MAGGNSSGIMGTTPDSGALMGMVLPAACCPAYCMGNPDAGMYNAMDVSGYGCMFHTMPGVQGMAPGGAAAAAGADVEGPAPCCAGWGGCCPC